MKAMSNDPEILEEYDFKKGVGGKYSKRYQEGPNVVVIDPDIVAFFPDHFYGKLFTIHFSNDSPYFCSFICCKFVNLISQSLFTYSTDLINSDF